MSSYSDLRKTQKMKTAAKHNAYKNGGEVAKKSGTTVNIVMSPSRGDAPKGAPIAPAGLTPPPSRSAPPVPPEALKAGLGAMGASPFAKGGVVKPKSVGASKTAAQVAKKVGATGSDARGNIVDAGGSGSKRKIHGGKQPGSVKMFANGGKVGKIPTDAGAGGAKARLEKAKDYGPKVGK